MKRIFILLWMVAMSLVQTPAGTIRGSVHAEGKPLAENGDAGGKYDSRKFKFVERINYAELRDFVVYIDGPLGTNTAPVSETPVQVVTTRKISQQGAMFSPHVLPIVVGTTVEWPNNDDVYHNVFSMSDANPFDLDLYKAPVAKKSPPFNKPGRVDVFCSIHANMHCTVLVLENTFFAVADASGKYVITNVPPGTYTLKAWHERLPAQTQQITVPDDGEVKVNFTLGIKNLPKY